MNSSEFLNNSLVMTQIFRIFSLRVCFADFLPFYEFLPFIYFNRRHHRTFFLSLSPLPLCFFFDWTSGFHFGSWDNQQKPFFGHRDDSAVFQSRVGSHLTVKDYNRERSYFERLKEFAKCFVNIWMFTYDNFSSFSIFSFQRWKIFLRTFSARMNLIASLGS